MNLGPGFNAWSGQPTSVSACLKYIIFSKERLLTANPYDQVSSRIGEEWLLQSKLAQQIPSCYGHQT